MAISSVPSGVRRRNAFTLIEALVVITIIGVLIALMLPAVECSREAARRVACHNQVKHIALALKNYEQQFQAFPAGTICNSRPTMPGHQYDVWAEAGKSGPGNQGTSFLLALLPFLEAEPIYDAWASGQDGSGTKAGCWSPADNVGTASTPGPAIRDFKMFYCPSRRISLSKENSVMMPSPAWTGGGTDYGGCAGRHAAFSPKTNYNLCDASMHFEPEFCPTDPANGKKIKDTEKSRWGILGRVNVCTKEEDVADGFSNTIIVGELQRITQWTPSGKDGWSIGGPATLFTTGAMVNLQWGHMAQQPTMTFVDWPTVSKLSNNGFYGSPGSEHNNGANYGMADGSVRYLNSTMDPSTFALLGSMDDGIPLTID